jgi:hypothetical protein
MSESDALNQLPVFAWDHFHLDAPDRWFLECQAYIGAATHLFAAMVERTFEPSWPRAKVAAFTFIHGAELFFKAAILLAGKPHQAGHDLQQLYNTFSNLYQGKKFAFSCSVPQLIEDNKKLPFEDFLKYPEDITKIGSHWNASVHIDVVTWYRQAKLFAADVERLWPAAKERYSK